MVVGGGGVLGVSRYPDHLLSEILYPPLFVFELSYRPSPSLLNIESLLLKYHVLSVTRQMAALRWSEEAHKPMWHQASSIDSMLVIALDRMAMFSIASI